MEKRMPAGVLFFCKETVMASSKHVFLFQLSLLYIILH